MTAESVLENFVEVKASGRQKKIVKVAREELLSLCDSQTDQDAARSFFAGIAVIKKKGGLIIQPLQAYYQILQELKQNGVLFLDAEWLGVVEAEIKESYHMRSGQAGKIFFTNAPDETFDTLVLSDRVFHNGNCFRRTPATKAAVFIDGADQFVNTKSGTAGIGLGLGVLGLGLGSTKHKNKRQDTRVASLVITDSTWQVTTNFHPDELSAVRALVERFGPPEQESNSPGASVVDQLSKLAELLEKGLLTDEEFATEKKKIIGG
jgi:hypothetical protein